MNEDTANSDFPGSFKISPTVPYPFYIGWCGFFILFFAKLFSHTEALANFGSCLMLVSLIWFRIILPPDRELLRLRLLFYVFLAAGLISSVLPNIGHDAFMKDSLSSLRNTVQGGIGAFLAFYLIKDKRLTSTILHLLVLTVGIVCISAVMQWVLLSENVTRLAGTKGNINRFAIMLFPAIVPVWVMLFSGSIKGSLDKKLFGRLSLPLVLIVPFLYIFSVMRGHPESINTSNLYLYMAIIIVCSAIVCQLLKAAGGRGFMVLVVILFFQISTLFLSGSRGAALSLVALAAVLALGWLRTGITKKKVIACVFVSIFVAVVFSLFWQRALVKLGNEREFNTRLIIWRGTMGLVKEYPVFGIGYGDKAFRTKWPKECMAPQEYERWDLADTWTPYHTHNLPLYYLAGGGTVGLTVFGLLLLSVLCLFIKPLYSQDKERSRIGLFGVALLAAMLVQGLVMNPLRAENELLYLLSFGLLLALLCPDKEANAVK